MICARNFFTSFLIFLAGVSWIFKKCWNNAKINHFSNLKNGFWFAMYQKIFWKTNLIFGILSWQHQKNLSSGFICGVISRGCFFIENWFFFEMFQKKSEIWDLSENPRLMQQCSLSYMIRLLLCFKFWESFVTIRAFLDNLGSKICQNLVWDLDSTFLPFYVFRFSNFQLWPKNFSTTTLIYYSKFLVGMFTYIFCCFAKFYAFIFSGFGFMV